MQKTLVITGASDGIGAAASRQLATSGARLILIGRSPEKTKAVASKIGAEYFLADYANLNQVRNLARELNEQCERIDVLANNAGGIFSGPTKTIDGFEKTFQVNHLAPYLLTNLLMPKLLRSRATVINTSSIGARLFSKLDLNDVNGWQNFDSTTAYGNAKLGNILFTKELHRRFYDQGLSTVALHPGNVATNFANDAGGGFHRIYHSVLNRLLISSDKGGERLRYFIEGVPGKQWISGEYYIKPGKIGRTNRLAYDDSVAQRYWQLSEEMLGISW